MSGATSTSFTQSVTGYRSAETRVDDTMQKIAARELGDAARWYDIVALNNLLPPYITNSLASAGPNVIFAGSTILIPSPAPAPSGVADPEAIFGTDCLLQDGQLTANANGDVATISGVPNLVQALENRLETHPGDLTFHPTYGCKVYTLLGQGADQSTLQLAASFVASAIQADPRISSVEGAAVSVTGDTVAVSATAITVDGKKQPVGTTGALSG